MSIDTSPKPRATAPRRGDSNFPIVADPALGYFCPPGMILDLPLAARGGHASVHRVVIGVGWSDT